MHVDKVLHVYWCVCFQALVLGNSTALFAFSSLRTGEEAAKEKYQIYVLIVALSSWVSNLIIFGKTLRMTQSIQCLRWVSCKVSYIHTVSCEEHNTVIIS